jgi:hypothetical protein
VHGAFGVVLAGLVGTEGGKDVVAGVLERAAAVDFNDGRTAREAPSITALTSSGSRRWANVVEPTTSRNRMLTCLSDWVVWGAMLCRACSRSRIAPRAASTTASPSKWR